MSLFSSPIPPLLSLAPRQEERSLSLGSTMCALFLCVCARARTFRFRPRESFQRCRVLTGTVSRSIFLPGSSQDSRARARARDPFVARVRALRHRCVRTKTRYSARSRSWPSETPISYNFRPPGVYYRNPQFQLETANARARYLTVHVHAQVSARVNSALVEEDVLPRHLTSFSFNEFPSSFGRGKGGGIDSRDDTQPR